jgi:hypothetical protein
MEASAEKKEEIAKTTGWKLNPTICPKCGGGKPVPHIWPKPQPKLERQIPQRMQSFSRAKRKV